MTDYPLNTHCANGATKGRLPSLRAVASPYSATDAGFDIAFAQSVIRHLAAPVGWRRRHRPEGGGLPWKCYVNFLAKTFSCKSKMDQTDGIVLRAVDFSETSLILAIYTQDFGKISAIAKGGRRLKGPFESSLDLLCRVRLSVKIGRAHV